MSATNVPGRDAAVTIAATGSLQWPQQAFHWLVGSDLFEIGYTLKSSSC
jgi:hypothetical protein